MAVHFPRRRKQIVGEFVREHGGISCGLHGMPFTSPFCGKVAHPPVITSEPTSRRHQGGHTPPYNGGMGNISSIYFRNRWGVAPSFPTCRENQLGNSSEVESFLACYTVCLTGHMSPFRGCGQSSIFVAVADQWLRSQPCRQQSLPKISFEGSGRGGMRVPNESSGRWLV